MTKVERCEKLERANELGIYDHNLIACTQDLSEAVRLIAQVLLDMNKPTARKAGPWSPKAAELFNQARLIYSAFGGVVRGNDTEFENFRKKRRDWEKFNPELKDCVEYQFAERNKLIKEGKWVPDLCSFEVWINKNRYERYMTG